VILSTDPLHPRAVAFISEIEPGIVMVEQMRFIPLYEARYQARQRDLGAQRTPPKLIGAA